MRVVVRGTAEKLRSWSSFSFSGLLHGAILAWLVLGTVGRPPEPRRSLYDMEIRPSEHRIVWYSLKNRLPDVTPTAPHDPRPPRARFKFNQTLVAGQRENDKPPQMIWMPAPEVTSPKPLPLPNLVAVQPAKPVRAFTPPPQKTAAPAQSPVLPQAPAIAAMTPNGNALLPSAELSGPTRKFTAPAAVKVVSGAPVLPAEPGIATALPGGAPALDAAAPRGPLRAFTRPVGAAPPHPEAADLPAAPAISGPEGSVEASLAIAGLNPATTPDLPEPPGSRDAGFSAGPALRTEGGTGAPSPSLLQVPGLLARGGSTEGKPTLVGRVLPFTREKLAEGAANLHAAAPPARNTAEPPDPVLQGRYVYSVAFQMPNITSYSGSWNVWFAEHEANARQENMQAPVPLRKVDPKYIASAAADGVEGKVRLYAVIRKDGRVDRIVLLKSLDARLDRSSVEALEKWLFEPARRSGVPVDVDAVFEIPFHLAPKPTK